MSIGRCVRRPELQWHIAIRGSTDQSVDVDRAIEAQQGEAGAHRMVQRSPIAQPMCGVRQPGTVDGV